MRLTLKLVPLMEREVKAKSSKHKTNARDSVPCGDCEGVEPNKLELGII
jgi:hypothetical protein